MMTAVESELDTWLGGHSNFNATLDPADLQKCLMRHENATHASHGLPRLTYCSLSNSLTSKVVFSKEGGAGAKEAARTWISR